MPLSDTFTVTVKLLSIDVTCDVPYAMCRQYRLKGYRLIATTLSQSRNQRSMPLFDRPLFSRPLLCRSDMKVEDKGEDFRFENQIFQISQICLQD